jgi:RNA polymerase sigma factor (sigma-70 family)
MKFSIKGYLNMPIYRKNPSDDDKDALYYYKKEISKLKPLTSEQELELATRVKAGDEAAREIMIEHNLRLVFSIAIPYQKYKMHLSDLIEEGNVGLIKAVDRFKPEMGFKFSTYADKWIRKEIERAIFNKNRTIKLPEHLTLLMNSYWKAVRELTLEEDKEPIIEDIARKMHSSPAQVELLKDYMQEMDSLDRPLAQDGGGDGDNDTLLQDVLEDTKQRDVAEELDEVKRKKILQGWMKKMSVVERKIIEMYYMKGINFEDIGYQLNISGQRAGVIAKSALESLRYHARKAGIKIEDIL